MAISKEALDAIDRCRTPRENGGFERGQENLRLFKKLLGARYNAKTVALEIAKSLWYASLQFAPTLHRNARTGISPRATCFSFLVPASMTTEIHSVVSGYVADVSRAINSANDPVRTDFLVSTERATHRKTWLNVVLEVEFTTTEA